MSRDRPRALRAPRPYPRGRRAWGISDRGGQREYLRDLVEDGQFPGLRVTRSERDPRHPQEFPLDASDAIALEHPSPERDTPSVVVLLPSPRPEAPAEVSNLPVVGTALGSVDAMVLTTPLGTFTGLESGVELGDLTPEQAPGVVNVFLGGLEAGARAGTLSPAVENSSDVRPTGLETGVQLGTLVPVQVISVYLTGLETGTAQGTTRAVSPDWASARFGVQFQGVNLLTREQRA